MNRSDAGVPSTSTRSGSKSPSPHSPSNQADPGGQTRGRRRAAPQHPDPALVNGIKRMQDEQRPMRPNVQFFPLDDTVRRPCFAGAGKHSGQSLG